MSARLHRPLLNTFLITTFGLIALGCGGGGSSGGGFIAPTGGGGGGSGGGTTGTTFSPSTATQMIYVSSSTGDDSNPGTQAEPFQTIAAGIDALRDGQPDWLLLKKGDVWDESLGGSRWKKSGTSPTEPMIVWTYGTGARPLLRTGSGGAMRVLAGQSTPTFVENLVISGLHFYAHTRDPSGPSFTDPNGAIGLQWLRGCRSLLLDDCVFQAYATGMVIEDFYGDGVSNVTLRRCQVLDSYSTGGHAQGILAVGINGLTIEECLFDNNGFNNQIAGAEPTIFNHNIYVTNSCSNVVVRKNIILRAASHGIQLRPGGVLEDNLFVLNPISVLLGGGTFPNPGGIIATATRNVLLEGNDIGTGLRGWGFELTNIQNVTLQDNIIANMASAGGNSFAIEDDPNTTYINNIVWNWPGSPSFESPGPFSDPDRSLATYNATQGGPATLEGFVANVRAQSRDNYNPAFTAEVVNQYLRGGFN